MIKLIKMGHYLEKMGALPSSYQERWNYMSEWTFGEKIAENTPEKKNFGMFSACFFLYAQESNLHYESSPNEGIMEQFYLICPEVLHLTIVGASSPPA